MLKSKLNAGNLKDALEAKLLSQLLNEKTEYTRILYFGQVISNTDNKNLNRIRVRIPLIDDAFYVNTSKEIGDNNLPWCLPISSRFIETPENNAIVAILISDPKTPFFGRIYFDCVTDLSATDLFERLTPEEQSLSNWLNAENSIEVNLPKPPIPQSYNVTQSIKRKIGIRGKSKNKLELNETNTLLIQNYKDRNKESFLNLSENSKLESADELELISKKGRNRKYHPVFDETLFNYLEKQNRMFQKIVILLNSIPAISPVGPCTASPTANQLVTELSSLQAELRTLKNIGSSQKLIIN